ncbi:MAG TPA: B12-binding domain-containing radical SAM protein, partial [Candidatus Eisenbacteria bacterium]|nr:B12-binding domain-containing radical SAM protein [Candidatus Eisenbacteria bacterium]
MLNGHPYASFLHEVLKPARYVGGEVHQIVKAPETVRVRMALAFPDVYDIGMSHLGTKILYSLLNKHPDLAAERVFCPWIDMERQLRERALPLLSLETATPLGEFDVVGFSLQ